MVGHPALIVARPVEWGTVLLGFEQANRYTVYDEAGQVVAHLIEEEGSLGRALGRQLLRTRRPFTATVLSPDGQQVVFRLRRPFYLINSTMVIEDGEGAAVGEVQQRWHLWKRRYDLYLGRRQFAAIEGGLLAWDFELRDQAGQTLALIDRNFQGFGKELFTDAGKYAIHFGSTPVAEAAGAEAGGGAAGAAGGDGLPSGMGEQPLERDLGDDKWGPQSEEPGEASDWEGDDGGEGGGGLFGALSDVMGWGQD